MKCRLMGVTQQTPHFTDWRACFPLLINHMLLLQEILFSLFLNWYLSSCKTLTSPSFCHAVPSLGDVIGFLGTNITLEFTFNSSVNLLRGGQIVIHKLKDSGKVQVAFLTPGKEDHSVYPQTKTLHWYKTELKMNDSGSYIASLLQKHAEKSNLVILKVQEPSISSTGMISSSRN